MPADVTRIGEWSHECRGAEWLDGASAAAPWVRFRQNFRILSMAAWADRAVAAMIPAHRDRTAALQADLRRLGEVAGVVRGNGG